MTLLWTPWALNWTYMTVERNGGYEAGYAACPCFWGVAPGSYVLKFLQFLPNVSGLRVLDAGCGEGKNAALLARMGAEVTAIDVSSKALENARNLHRNTNVKWICADILEQPWPAGYFDIVVAYGLFHCMPTLTQMIRLHNRLCEETKIGGYHIVCAFNDRNQDLSAHPNFSPCLVSHEYYAKLYRQWNIMSISDEDLQETHPHNQIPHTHSLTRLLARKCK